MILHEQNQRFQRFDFDCLNTKPEYESNLRLMRSSVCTREDISDTTNLFFEDKIFPKATTELYDARWAVFVARDVRHVRSLFSG